MVPPQKNKLGILKPQKRSRLIGRMIVVTIGGFDEYMDDKSRRYLRVLCRLVDKAYREYEILYESLNSQATTGDRLEHWEKITDHLENYINTLARSSNIFRNIKDDNASYIKNLLSTDTLEYLAGPQSRKIRNRIEHLDEDIQKEKPLDSLAVRVSEDYTLIQLGKERLDLHESYKLLQYLDAATRQILESTPTRIENGRPFFD